MDQLGVKMNKLWINKSKLTASQNSEL